MKKGGKIINACGIWLMVASLLVAIFTRGENGMPFVFLGIALALIGNRMATFICGDWKIRTKDLKDKEVVILGYKGLSKEIVVPSEIDGMPVTKINTVAFAGKTDITKVVLPNSVTEIDGWAFRNCRSLKSIKISENLILIGHGAFSNCSSLTDISIPEGKIKIKESAFDGCNSLPVKTLEKIKTIQKANS